MPPLHAVRRVGVLAVAPAVGGTVAAPAGAVGAVAGAVLGALAALTARRWGHLLPLHAMRAYRVSEVAAPRMHALVREMAAAARVAVPALYVSPTDAPNAFVTGRGGQPSALCLTEGLVAALDERQLRAVVAHELAHVRRGDLGASCAAGALARSVLMGRAALAPAAGLLLRAGSGRRRELDTDREAALLTGDPLALASALRVVHSGVAAMPLPPEPGLLAARHLMLADPLRPSDVPRGLATHPPMADRVARLEELAGYRR